MEPELQVEAAAELRRKVDELDEKIKGLRKEAQKQTTEGAKLNRAKASHQAAMETLQGRAADLIQAAAMEQVPRLNDSVPIVSVPS